MKTQNKLWDEFREQKAILEAQKDRFFQQCRLLADAVMTGQITQWEEVETLAYELMVFGDYYVPALDLWWDLRAYISQHFSEHYQQSAMLQLIYSSAEKPELTTAAHP